MLDSESVNKMSDILKKIKPCDENQPYIFISYSSADAETVYDDVFHFQQKGYNIWLDEKNLDKTKSSWKDDAINAISDLNCELVVFYVSRNSLKSIPCYNEMISTKSEEAKALHEFKPVKFIAIELEDIGDIRKFSERLHKEVRYSDDEKKVKEAQLKVLAGFLKDFFNSNNEKVRLESKFKKNRKLDYLEEITSYFPDTTQVNKRCENLVDTNRSADIMAISLFDDKKVSVIAEGNINTKIQEQGKNANNLGEYNLKKPEEIVLSGRFLFCKKKREYIQKHKDIVEEQITAFEQLFSQTEKVDFLLRGISNLLQTLDNVHRNNILWKMNVDTAVKECSENIRLICLQIQKTGDINENLKKRIADVVIKVYEILDLM